jgi:Icc-related predicted phosphoesterase
MATFVPMKQRFNTPNVQFASDLHLEFTANSDFLRKNPLIPVADVLVLAGDIGYLGHESYESHPFWDWASDNFRQVVVVPGNHEFYGGYDLANLHNGMRVDIRKNVQWHYNSVITIDNTELILSPLFSAIPPDAETIITHRLADFTYIEHNGEKLSVERYNKLHSDCREFLKAAFSTPKAGRRIVVTHHAPSFKCVHPDFAGSILNCAFYNDLDELIEKSGADHWMYGHSHRNVGVVEIGDTTLLSNQLGYVHLKENRSFDNSMQIF